jgi:hypothetical protein
MLRRHRVGSQRAEVMGVILEFQARSGYSQAIARSHAEPAQVVILPVIRIERYDGDSTPMLPQSRKKEIARRRRRRASR